MGPCAWFGLFELILAAVYVYFRIQYDRRPPVERRGFEALPPEDEATQKPK